MGPRSPPRTGAAVAALRSRTPRTGPAAALPRHARERRAATQRDAATDGAERAEPHLHLNNCITLGFNFRLFTLARLGRRHVWLPSGHRGAPSRRGAAQPCPLPALGLCAAPGPISSSPSLFSSPCGSERGAAGSPRPFLARRRSNTARSLPAPTGVNAAATGPPRPRALPPLGRGRGEGSGGGGGVPGGSSAARARPARGIVGRRAAGGGGSGGRRGGVKGQRPPAPMAGGASAGGRDRAAPPSPRPVPRRRVGAPRRGTGPGRAGFGPPLFPGLGVAAPLPSSRPSALRRRLP